MFVKVLKQRFSIGYNRLNERKGTLWEGPFRSVLVENSREALVMVGAYIDLNAVRAGIVEDPKDYRFCGYGEAVGKGKLGEYALLRRLAGMGFGVEGRTETGVVEKWRGGGGGRGVVMRGGGGGGSGYWEAERLWKDFGLQGVQAAFGGRQTGARPMKGGDFGRALLAAGFAGSLGVGSEEAQLGVVRIFASGLSLAARL